MLDTEPIRRELRRVLMTAGTLPAAGDMFWQNRPGDPPPPNEGASFLRESLEVISERLTANGQQTVLGQAVYSVNVPVGTSTEALQAIVKAIGDVLVPGRWLQASPTCPFNTFRVERGSSGITKDQPTWFFQNLIVSWRAHYIVAA